MDTQVFVDQMAWHDIDAKDQNVEFPLEKNQVEFWLRTWVMTMVQKQALSGFQIMIGNQLG